jgi:transposase InsO family protein
MAHSNAKLTPAGRRRLVSLVEDEGLSLGVAARRSGVSKSTAWEWTCRWRGATPSERESGVCLLDRSSRPHHSPRRVQASVEEAILAEREATGWGPRLIAGRVGVCHSTVHAVLARAGKSQLTCPVREPANRYEWPCPGDLLHMDTKRYARFDRPGHAVTGDRTIATPGAGYSYAHAIVDDHSRLAYVELHPDEQAQTVTQFTKRALAWFEARGIRVKRLMTDNAWAYTKNKSLKDLLTKKEIRHIRIRPYRPRTNGKVERFHQTMAREWGYGQIYKTHHHRDRALPYWIDYYNEQRPHSALGGKSPISRVRNLPGHDI